MLNNFGKAGASVDNTVQESIHVDRWLSRFNNPSAGGRG